MTKPSPHSSAPSGTKLARRAAQLILRSFKAEPANHAVALGGAVVYSLSLVAFTRAISWATDSVIVPALSEGDITWGTAVAASGVVMAIAFLRGIGAAFRRYFLAVAEFRTEQLWRQDLFDHYLKQPLSVLRAHPAGRLIAHVDNDVNTAGMMLKPLAFAVATIVLAIAAVASLFEIHLWFGLLALILFPSLALLNRRFSNSVEEPAAQAQAAVGDVTSVAHESFDGAMMVKTLGLQEREVARFKYESEELRKRRLEVGRINTFYQPLLGSLPNIGALGMLVIGAGMIGQGSITVGDLIGALTLLSVLALPLRIFAFFLQSMPPSVVALDRIDRFLAVDGRQRSLSNHSVSNLTPHELLVFDDVTFSYGDGPSAVPLLTGLTFSLHRGETVALVGNTGSGKTTIAELAAGLLNPTSGTVRRRTEASLYPVLQEAFLFNDSVANNIALGAHAAEHTIVEAAKISKAHDFISQLPEGYSTIIGERGVTLSGGQRQRIALARSLVRQPDILVLDDATSAIDPVVEANILAQLRALKPNSRDLTTGDLSFPTSSTLKPSTPKPATLKPSAPKPATLKPSALKLSARRQAISNDGSTMLIIANRLSTIRLADRVLFLQQGMITASGSHDELLKISDYRTLVAAEFATGGKTTPNEVVI